MDEALIIGITMRDLQEWVRNGVRTLHAEDRQVVPVAVDPAEPKGIEPEMQMALVQLPGKYAARLAAGQVPLALVDEIWAVSLTTRDLTTQWSVRMGNLGERWLPFSFQEGWTCRPVVVQEPADPIPVSAEPPIMKKPSRSKKKGNTDTGEGQTRPSAADKPVRARRTSGVQRKRVDLGGEQAELKVAEGPSGPGGEVKEEGTKEQPDKTEKELVEP